MSAHDDSFDYDDPDSVQDLYTSTGISRIDNDDESYFDGRAGKKRDRAYAYQAYVERLRAGTELGV